MLYDGGAEGRERGMMTVHEVSGLTGVSIRALQFYDQIGLLPPAGRTEAGYRLYDESSLETLQQILLFRELGFPLKEIRAILSDPGFDRQKALRQQIELLTLQRDRLDNMIHLARNMQQTGGTTMDFQAFDKTKLEEYAARARQEWGGTAAYREFEEKDRGRTQQDRQALGDGLMAALGRLGALRAQGPDAPAVQAAVEELRGYITAHFYTCTPEILAGLGQMYASGGEFTRNINAACGAGTAEFAGQAIRAYCEKCRKAE